MAVRLGYWTSIRKAAALGVVGLAAVACTAKDVEYTYPDVSVFGNGGYGQQGPGVFGGDGLTLFGGGNKPGADQGGGGGIGVNGFLWRAALDSISFMPLASADPFGGVIITDWYPPPETPGERFKLNVIITDRQLRADALRVAVFRQRRDLNGGWTDVGVEPKTATDLENAILTRARQLRIDTAQRQ